MRSQACKIPSSCHVSGFLDIGNADHRLLTVPSPLPSAYRLVIGVLYLICY